MSQQDADKLREALIPFARIWAINAPLNPDPARPVAQFIAGVWPTMADAKLAYDLVWRREPDHCHAAGRNSDGECTWDGCPQARDGEPHATGRHCPLDTRHED